MTPANRRANIAAEFARADESMRAARVLVDAGLRHDAESRLYYAIYHAAMAILLTEGIEPRSHAGTTSLLGLHFVKTGRMDPDDARLFARIQKYRIEADYGRDFVLTDAAIKEDLAACEGFLKRARTLTSP
ncbi:MAG: HEPN domain-containing protein [Vicinamibacterales bacterium]|nr:HEPN domain-containing protein [Vicinamibacterales bacterium]